MKRTLKQALYQLVPYWVFLLAGIMLTSVVQGESLQQPTHQATEKEAFAAGEMIIDHVVDAHEWHIAVIGHTQITIPLPVILWHDGQLYAFSSSNFHHGHDAYNGFRLMSEGLYKGKIISVAMATDGLEVINPNIPLDFSITKNVLSVFMSSALIAFLFIVIARNYKRTRGHAPKGIQSLMEPIILFIRDDIAKASIGHHYEKFTPYLLTIFFFIFLNNLLGIVPFFPGGANVTGNIGVTAVLALFTFGITTFSGNKAYWKHIFNAPGVPWWLKLPVPLMPIVELVGVFTKPFVLMVRLFANITAGHIIILGFMSLIFIFGNMNPVTGYSVSIVSVGFAIFMGLLECLVALIQAYVFTLLSAIYFGMATEDHH